MRFGAKLLQATLAAFAFLPAAAWADMESPAPACDPTNCHYRLTADQLLSSADKLIAEHRFDEAAPLLAALENAPQLSMERDFLVGYAAVETGKLDKAIKIFRHILDTHPDQTRVRLELGRALMMQGKSISAEHHLRLAEQDRSLPEDIAATVRATRGILRQKRNWSFNLDLGIAPDSNITNGTTADSVNVNLGPFILPLALDADARQKAGTGQTLNMAGTTRLGFVGETRLLIEANSQMVNYKGKSQDDLSTEVAIGPELDLTDDLTLTVQGLSAQRWYGGKKASSGFGLRVGIQHELNGSQRLGLSFDARQNKSGFSDAYSGWQIGGQASYERVVARRFIASATLFGRRDSLNSSAFSGIEAGANLGIGGELPLGITAGVSAGASRAWYDAPLAIFSSSPRRDWRLNGRVQFGLRSIRVLGFSPSVAYNYSASLSSLSLYDSKRSRLRFALARYF
jgi:outer membrane protein